MAQRSRKSFLAFAALVLLAIACAYLTYPRPPAVIAAPSPAGADNAGLPLYWFKGNTHAHARISLPGFTHGDSSRAAVARWYRDHGYHFLSITDHNVHAPAGTLPPGAGAAGGLLLIPGMEVTSDHRYPGVSQAGERKIHTVAFNTRNAVEWNFPEAAKSGILSLQAHRITEAGGIPIVSHPNYRFQLEAEDLLDAQGILLFELANAHPRANLAGHAGFRPSVEGLWDAVLSRNKLLYGVATDDAHDFSWYRRALRSLGFAPPGGAWIMVRAPQLSAAAIAKALQAGDFYASTGVFLADAGVSGGRYRVTVDMERTRHETRHAWVRDAAPVVESDHSHFVIEFIGSHGRILHAVHDRESASVPLEPAFGYVRARVVYLEKLPDWLERDRARVFRAWTQPVMTGRASLPE